MPAKHTRATALAAFAVGATLALPSLAEYPERPVTIIAPYGPGGSSDVLGRVLAERLSEALGGSVIVENRPGAGSRVGTEAVARAAADGHTLLLADMPFAIVPNIHADAAYSVDDFVAIGQIGVAPMILFARPDFDGDSVGDVVAAAGVAPEALLIGSGGIGATTHMMAELFQRAVGVELLHVPFEGAGPALQGLAGSQVDLAFSTYPTAASLLQAGSIRVIGVAADDRLELLADVETFAEAGHDLSVEHWWGLLAPAGTPDAVVETLRSALRDVLTQDQVAERMAQLSVQPGALDADAFQAFLASESDRWSAIIEEAGISIDQ
ncbi:MAG: Bug family tripartite tricarboxylate transporter substrate binding protein [Alkalilacustris sp.]